MLEDIKVPVNKYRSLVEFIIYGNPCLKSTGYGPSAHFFCDKMANSPTREVSHVIKFNGKNFPLWKFGCWLKLEQHNLVNIVNGTEELPEEV